MLIGVQCSGGYLTRCRCTQKERESQMPGDGGDLVVMDRKCQASCFYTRTSAVNEEIRIEVDDSTISWKSYLLRTYRQCDNEQILLS